MPAPIHVTRPARPVPETRHKCPIPGCTWLLSASRPACKQHRAAWRAMEAARRAAIVAAMTGGTQ